MTDATSDDNVGIKLHQTMDGLIWAEEFMNIWYEKFNCDPAQITTEWLHSWFANAIMCGFERAISRERQAAKVLEDGVNEYIEIQMANNDEECISVKDFRAILKLAKQIREGLK